MKPTKLLTILTALLLSPAAGAYPGAIGGAGRFPVPAQLRPSAAVALTSAKIVITDGVRTSYKSLVRGGGTLPLHNVGFVGTFVLKNVTPQARMITVGFPVAVASFGAGGDRGELTGLSFKIDGAAVRPQLTRTAVEGTVLSRRQLPRRALDALLKRGLARALPGDPQLVDLAKLGRTLKRYGPQVLALKGVSKRDKQRLVKALTRHYTDPGDAAVERVEERWYTLPLKLGPANKARASRTLEIRYLSPRGDAILNAKQGYTFGHTLTQAALWRGPIARCSITLQLKARPPSHYMIKPRGYRRAGRTVVYKHRDFVPRADLVAEVRDAP